MQSSNQPLLSVNLEATQQSYHPRDPYFSEIQMTLFLRLRNPCQALSNHDYRLYTMRRNQLFSSRKASVGTSFPFFSQIWLIAAGNPFLLTTEVQDRSFDLLPFKPTVFVLAISEQSPKIPTFSKYLALVFLLKFISKKYL